MKIRIKRNSNILSGALLKNKIWINGEFSGKIAHDEEKELSLPANNSEVQVKQFSGKSNTIVVSDGDWVEIRHTPWQFAIYIFLFMLGFTLQILNLTNSLVYILAAIIIFIVFSRGINLFRLTKSHGTINN
ncbi:MAG: hypothetical protein JJU01_09010 [Alkalibacterium sp.]|nr:hypothetical protein [Alkalibacterium sp.]